jgi:hypothetical protein
VRRPGRGCGRIAGEPMSAAPSSAASGSARAARIVRHSRGDCSSAARKARGASFAARPRGEMVWTPPTSSPRPIRSEVGPRAQRHRVPK